MKPLIFRMIKQMVKSGRTYEEIITNPYLTKHFNIDLIDKTFDEVIINIKYWKERQENYKNHLIAVRLDDICFNLTKNNRSDMIRTAILHTYKEGSA